MMKSLGAIAILVLIFSRPVNAAGQEVGGMVGDIRLTGGQFKILEIAAAEFEKTNLDILKYKVSLFGKESSFLVLFEDRDIGESQRGSSPDTLSFEVEVGSGFQVLRANYVR